MELWTVWRLFGWRLYRTARVRLWVRGTSRQRGYYLLDAYDKMAHEEVPGDTLELVIDFQD